METEIQSAYRAELQQLEKTAAEIERQLQTLQSIPRYYGNDLTEQALDNIRESQRRNLAIATTEPYFGRLDFQEKGKEDPMPFYIGKVGVEEETTGQLLVIDWRAPVASMFYSFSGGDDAASYESPEGVIDGLVYLKRNLVVRKQILQRVVDSYVRGSDNLGVTDEFLLYRLQENKDNRLRDIVSTIQAEQDLIIRAAKNKALVIQGVAGSGKTTVALHRLAYLLYQYRENIRSEKMIIFAPNSMFLDYISSVLPELGVGGIRQTTFNDWALDLLDHEVKLTDPANRLNDWFEIGKGHDMDVNERPGRVKGSADFLQYMDECLRAYEKAFMPEEDFAAWDGAKLKAKTIHEWFYQDYKHYPLMHRRERLVGRIKRWLEMELANIADPNRRKERKKKSAQRLRTYIKCLPNDTPFTFYRSLFAAKAPDYLLEELAGKIPAPIAEKSGRSFRKKEVDQEDLAPLLFIRNYFYGMDKQDVFDHVVIDEAQDFSPFQVALLKRHTPGNSFTILGDLSQGIHADLGILDWQEFLSLFETEESAFFRLNRSYRSTMEIINFANEIIARSGEQVTLAQPVFRSGEKVQVAQVPAAEQTRSIARLIKQLRSGDINTVAIIGRTEKECGKLHQGLLDAGVEANLIESKQTSYRGGISVLPVYLAKGLEFDSVLLTDVDTANYGQNVLDAKLLYVGCTRALHRLTLLYSGEASPLIQNLPQELYTAEM